MGVFYVGGKKFFALKKGILVFFKNSSIFPMERGLRKKRVLGP